MSKNKMSSLERVMTAISHKEPDKVPLFLLLSIYGAKEMSLSPKEYFSEADNIIETQIKVKKKYNNDLFYTFYYAGIEIEAFGGEVIFTNEGPPNTGRPIINKLSDIDNLKVPEIKSNPHLKKVLDTTKALEKEDGKNTPIIGVVMSPFSLPIMQMGFEKYLETIYFNKKEFNKLMQLNQEFCINWANEQLSAGATAICYFNPLASPNNIEKKTYLKTGYPIDKYVISKINGPVATHLASGITKPVIEQIIETNSLVLGISNRDNLEELKKIAKGRICLLGNLNAIEMTNWTLEKAKKEVRNVLDTTKEGGGLILSDNHGEIPWQVDQEILMKIAETVDKYGRYE